MSKLTPKGKKISIALKKYWANKRAHRGSSAVIPRDTHKYINAPSGNYVEKYPLTSDDVRESSPTTNPNWQENHVESLKAKITALEVSNKEWQDKFYKAIGQIQHARTLAKAINSITDSMMNI